MSSFFIPALFMASSQATAPNVFAGTDFKLPPKLPIGVRAALAITTFLIPSLLKFYQQHPLEHIVAKKYDKKTKKRPIHGRLLSFI